MRKSIYGPPKQSKIELPQSIPQNLPPPMRKQPE